MGLSNEIETGDTRFDELVYIACDHPFVGSLLTHSPELRAAIVAAFDAGFDRIELDGITVWMQRSAKHEPTDDELRLLAAIHRASSPLADKPPSRLGDPFLWKALVVEGVVWGILGYAIGAFVELYWTDEDYHLDRDSLAPTGLIVGLGLFVFLLAVIVLWMRASSRGHRIIVESALVLLIALPTAGMQLVSDTNRALDNADSIHVTARIDQCREQKHRKSPTTYRVWLADDAQTSTVTLPREIKVTAPLCFQANRQHENDHQIELEIRQPGRWGFPWYRRIRIGERDLDRTQRRRRR